MPSLEVPSRPEPLLLVLGYLCISQAHVLPDGFALLGYVIGFFLIVLIPLSILENADSRSDASSAK
ncbi:hypothetical protein [Haladaptatus sp. R4]|uniref:hypothetical protein n=1 Tax=Haladaptatus sp. R4 TaxID=1679489 RepID=UPI0009EE4FE7|nr:hypothetical protein [Haladaptatus sp. R4]